MGLRSVWQGGVPARGFESLSAELHADVVVVGAGITGLSAALELATAGRSVVVLEAEGVGQGTTGRSTGNLYATVSEGFAPLAERWGDQVAEAVVGARHRAMERIEERVRDHGIDCGFERCPLVLYPASDDGVEPVDREHDALRALGLPVRREDQLPAPLPRPAGAALVLEHQAQFHPLAYVQGLAEACTARGVRIFEGSPALEVDAKSGRVRTGAGSVTAADLVLATHSPKGFHLVQAAMLPGQEYGLAFRTDGPSLPPGIFWGRGEPHESLRSLRWNGEEHLIVVGEPQQTGRHDPQASVAVLQAQARHRFGVTQPAFRWSAQNFKSADGLPYIGRDASGAWIATGFATDGLTWGTVAATMIAEQILGRGHPLADTLKPGRFSLVKGGKGIAEENLAVARALVRDYLTDREAAELAIVAPGEGRIVRVDGESMAAYRSPQGELQVVSAVCTHLKCRVHWNAAETSWDCPCHGSRFAPDGRVLEGPAIEPLARRAVPDGAG